MSRKPIIVYIAHFLQLIGIPLMYDPEKQTCVMISGIWNGNIAFNY
jgi:hypothetical protein